MGSLYFLKPSPMNWHRKGRTFRYMCFAPDGFAPEYWNLIEIDQMHCKIQRQKHLAPTNHWWFSECPAPRWKAGLSPAEVAAQVYNAIQNGTFYIHTHPEHKAWIRERMKRILE